MHRRTFLRTLGSASIGLCAFTPHIPGLAQAAPVRRVAVIGTGWYGKVDVLRLIQVEPIEVVAICDVDRNMLNEAAEIIASRQKSGKKPRVYTDYRKMLGGRDFEIVIIGTPDHWHALTAIASLEAGAHIYLQKPISTDVIEARAILAAARRHKKVVQIGLQRRSTPHLIEARDTIVREGKLGKVGMVEVFCYTRPRPGRKNPEEAPPEYLDWEMWTGPAPMRPYAKGIHPRSWRGFMEYGNGYVGDMGVHMLDMARWMLELPAPTTISAVGGNLVNDWATTNIPDTQSAFFDFGKVKMVWQQRAWGRSADPKYNWGATIYGDKGTLTAGVHGYDFTPVDGEPIHKDVVMELEQFPEDKTEKDLERHVAPAIRRHMKDFLHCIDNGGRPVSDVEEGCISTVACILANVAMTQGKSLVWDDKAGTLKGEPQADKLLRRPYRAHWKHPEA